MESLCIYWLIAVPHSCLYTIRLTLYLMALLVLNWTKYAGYSGTESIKPRLTGLIGETCQID